MVSLLITRSACSALIFNLKLYPRHVRQSGTIIFVTVFVLKEGHVKRPCLGVLINNDSRMLQAQSHTALLCSSSRSISQLLQMPGWGHSG